MRTCTIGIDVGGTTIKAVVADACGEIAAKWQVDTPHGGDALVVRVAQLVQQIESEVALLGIELAREVAVAVPGVVDEESGRAVLSVNLGWRDYPMRQKLAEALHRDPSEVALAHDLHAGALAESRIGVQLPTFHFLALGTGLASATIVNGAPLRLHPWSDEIGQVPTVDENGQAVRLEEMCSAKAFGRLMTRLLKQQAEVKSGAGQLKGSAAVCEPAPASIISHPDSDFSHPDCASSGVVEYGTKETFAAYWDGDETAAQAISIGLDYLTQAIVWMSYVHGPIPVVIGGGIAKEGPKLLDLINAKLASKFQLLEAPQLYLAKLGSWSQALGAALISADLATINANRATATAPSADLTTTNHAKDARA